jgi:hypothetical protein
MNRRRKRAWKAQTDSCLATLACIPGAEPFLPLLRSGSPMAGQDLRGRIDYLALRDRFALREHFRPLEAALKPVSYTHLTLPTT